MPATRRLPRRSWSYIRPCNWEGANPALMFGGGPKLTFFLTGEGRREVGCRGERSGGYQPGYPHDGPIRPPGWGSGRAGDS